MFIAATNVNNILPNNNNNILNIKIIIKIELTSKGRPLFWVLSFKCEFHSQLKLSLTDPLQLALSQLIADGLLPSQFPDRHKKGKSFCLNLNELKRRWKLLCRPAATLDTPFPSNASIWVGTTRFFLSPWPNWPNRFSPQL